MRRSCWFDVDSIWFWWWIRVTALWVRSEGEISEFWVVRRVRTLEERHEVSALFWVLALYPEVMRFVCSWNCQEMSRVKIVSIVKGPRGFQLSFHSAKAEYSIKECSKNMHLGMDWYFLEQMRELGLLKALRSREYGSKLQNVRKDGLGLLFGSELDALTQTRLKVPPSTATQKHMQPTASYLCLQHLLVMSS